MTKQDYYDLLVEAADNGTFPSMDGCTCFYRGPGGSKCAVGILIPDKDYSSLLEYSTVRELPSKLVQQILPEGMDISDLENIQKAHDAFNRVAWEANAFLKEINKLECFRDVNKKEVTD